MAKINIKIKKLIQRSQALSKESKAKYLRILNFLPGNELKRLLEILENEQEQLAKIEKEMKKEESNFNRKYLAELEDLYKKEYKKGVKAEEKEERERAEEILKKIKD